MEKKKDIDRIFMIAVTTPYPENDIVDFMALTGMALSDTEKLLERFSKVGISNLNDVNTLVKLGHFRK